MSRAETPKQSLAEILAKAVEDAIKRIEIGYDDLPLIEAIEDLYKYANNLRNKAKDEEG